MLATTASTRQVLMTRQSIVPAQDRAAVVQDNAEARRGLGRYRRPCAHGWCDQHLITGRAPARPTDDDGLRSPVVRDGLLQGNVRRVGVRNDPRQPAPARLQLHDLLVGLDEFVREEAQPPARVEKDRLAISLRRFCSATLTRSSTSTLGPRSSLGIGGLRSTLLSLADYAISSSALTAKGQHHRESHKPQGLLRTPE